MHIQRWSFVKSIAGGERCICTMDYLSLSNLMSRRNLRRKILIIEEHKALFASVWEVIVEWSGWENFGKWRRWHRFTHFRRHIKDCLRDFYCGRLWFQPFMSILYVLFCNIYVFILPPFFRRKKLEMRHFDSGHHCLFGDLIRRDYGSTRVTTQLIKA